MLAFSWSVKRCYLLKGELREFPRSSVESMALQNYWGNIKCYVRIIRKLTELKEGKYPSILKLFLFRLNDLCINS